MITVRKTVYQNEGMESETKMCRNLKNLIMKLPITKLQEDNPLICHFSLKDKITRFNAVWTSTNLMNHHEECHDFIG